MRPLKIILLGIILSMPAHSVLSQSLNGSIIGSFGLTYPDSREFLTNSGEQISLEKNPILGDGFAGYAGLELTRNFRYGMFISTRLLYHLNNCSFIPENATAYEMYEIDFSNFLFSIRAGSDLVRSLGWPMNKNKSVSRNFLNSSSDICF